MIAWNNAELHFTNGYGRRFHRIFISASQRSAKLRLIKPNADRLTKSLTIAV
jgi:hypothetical protein